MKDAYAVNVMKADERDLGAVLKVRGELDNLESIMKEAHKVKQGFDKSHGNDCRKLTA